MLRCTHCNGLFVPAIGGTHCPRCDGVLREGNSKAESSSITSPPSKLSLKSFNAAAQVRTPPALTEHKYQPRGRPSDHRPEGVEICFHCDGIGVVDNRTCSLCGGRGYGGRGYVPAQSNLSQWKPHPFPETPAEPKVRSSIFGRQSKSNLAEPEPWLKAYLPPQSLCIACRGMTKAAKCPRCKGRGIDPWALDPAIEHQALLLYEKGWRPSENAERKVFSTSVRQKTQFVPGEVWQVLHHVCAEKTQQEKEAAKPDGSLRESATYRTKRNDARKK